MEVICIEGFENASFSGPERLKPSDYPKKGEIYNVTNTMRNRGVIYYFLKEFGNEIVFNYDAFENITNLSKEIDSALKKNLKPKLIIITTPLGIPDWIKRFNDL